MHEFALCNELVNAVLTEAAKHDYAETRVVRVRVVIGKLRQIVPDTMKLAFESIARETAAEEAELEMVFKQICVYCEGCGWEGELSNSIFVCPQCQGRQLQLITGDELYLDQIEVEENDENK